VFGGSMEAQPLPMDPQPHLANISAVVAASLPQAHDAPSCCTKEEQQSLCFPQLDIAISMPTDASSDSDSDYIAKPRSILKSRSTRPSVAKTASSFSSLFGCSRRLPAAACCARRPGKRISFCASVEVTEYSKAFGRDRVPADGSGLAVGLGKETWKGLVPLARPHHGKRVDTLPYLPEEERADLLRASIGHERFNDAIERHRDEIAEVIRLRKDALEDSKEPHEMMPLSYQEACDRALKVAAEARDVAASFDPLAASVAMANFAMQSKLAPPSWIATAADIVVEKPPQTFTCLKRKRQPSKEGTPMESKAVCLKTHAVCLKTDACEEKLEPISFAEKRSEIKQRQLDHMAPKGQTLEMKSMDEPIDVSDGTSKSEDSEQAVHVESPMVLV